MSLDWPYPGARWWKFDFHAHTPKSKDSYWAKNKADLAPEDWLKKWMAADIDCVAITDHNSGEWIDSLKAAYEAMEASPDSDFRELHLFPGVEISVNGGFHLLALFDPSKGSSDIASLLGRVEYGGTPGDSDGVTQKGAAEVVECILKAGAIPIPAHADQDKGLLRLRDGSSLQSALDSNTLKQVINTKGLLAMEVLDRTQPKPEVYTQAKVNWAEVLGSDCHSFQGQALPGSRFTFVKMETPSIDGLRLALLDGQEISIRRSDDPGDFLPFKLPEHFIESIEIREAKAMGRRTPVKLTFSPYFNALIGGRGTGKSTVVHALRLAYNRGNDLPGGEAKDTFSRFNKVSSKRNDPGGLREDTSVTTVIQRDGIRHRLCWSQGKPSTVEDYVDRTWKTSSSPVIDSQRFPLQIFSQGQIASLVGESDKALLDVIDAAAGTTSKKATLEEAKRDYFSTQAKLREYQAKLTSREGIEISLQDVQRKLSRFEETHHAEILKTFQRTSRQNREVSRQFESVTESSARIKRSAEDLMMENVPDSLFDPAKDTEALAVFHELGQAVAHARSQMATIAQSLEEKISTLKQTLQASAWQAGIDQAKSAYEQLKVQLQEQGVSDPSEYGRLVQERQQLENSKKQMDLLQQQVSVLEQESVQKLSKVSECRQAISEHRSDFLQQTLAGNDYVKMDLVSFGSNEKDLEASLRDLLEVPDAYQDEFFSEGQGTTPAGGMVSKLKHGQATAIEELIRSLKQQLLNACLGNGNFRAKFNNTLKDKATPRPDLIDHIQCWFPEDGLNVQYSPKGDGKSFQSIEQASAGQRASAMLAFLLAYGDKPLVLDQPEDDLDNHLIYDLVVQQIRSNKQRRQLIIVTHNPNIVVNGDAEYLHALDFNNQCFVKHQGSLQDRTMREEVCTIMEGGTLAFERRYRRLARNP